MTAAPEGSGAGSAAGDAGRRLVDEALRLVEALRDADGVRDRAADAASAFLGVGADAQGAAHTGPECRACPVCRVIAAVRTLRPEAVEHLALAAAELANAWREVVAGAQDAAPPPPTPREEPCVEPIVVTD
ncbi:hypothetical protein [Kineosporia sp. A_224]|uniref:hypothetical protein n=1 Tax=Kineosporia sp. A_224 TaxID=1962180 RepID=UPI00117B4655|nr:hypothetical protein [Kineosporia sp. A_224]